MQHRYVTFRCVQSAVQVKQQHTCAVDVWLAVWITCLLGVKRPGRVADHYTASSSNFKETFTCISTSHYDFLNSYFIISFILTQHCVTTEGFKASKIFALMPHIVHRGVSFLCAQSFNFDIQDSCGRLLLISLLLLLLLLLCKQSTHLSLYRLIKHVFTFKNHYVKKLDTKYKSTHNSCITQYISQIYKSCLHSAAQYG